MLTFNFGTSSPSEFSLPCLSSLMANPENSGKIIKCIRTDEDGALAHSSEFTSMLLDDFQFPLESTGGYASWLNGKNKRINETINKVVRTQLLDSGKDANFWCCAADCATKTYNSILHLATNKQPHYSWYGVCTHMSNIMQFSCVLYPINND
eukprot:9564392-Ditylum_brightwellii.AAC.1